jgi:hypothetical protein
MFDRSVLEYSLGTNVLRDGKAKESRKTSLKVTNNILWSVLIIYLNITSKESTTKT